MIHEWVALEQKISSKYDWKDKSNMDDKLYKILKKVYCKKRYAKDENGYNQPVNTGDKFDCDTKTTNYSLSILNDKENEYLLLSGYPVNEVTGYTHDECIHAYKKLLEHPNLYR